MAVGSLLIAVGALLPASPSAAQDGEPREANTKLHSGTLLAISDTSLTITSDGQKEQSHAIVRDATISLNGEPAAVDDLRAGDQVRVVTPPDGKSALAIEAIRVEPRTTAIGPRAVVAQVIEPQPPVAEQPRSEVAPPAPAENEPAAPASSPPADADRAPRIESGTANQSKRGMLGVFVGPNDLGATGLRVMEVKPDGPAAKAGIRQGDLLLSLGEQPLDAPQRLGELVQEHASGDRVALTVMRNGERFRATATLGDAEDLEGEAETRGFRGVNQDDDSEQAWLGIIVHEQARDNAQGETAGAVVRRVYPAGPAWRAGVRDDDRITAVDDKPVASANDLFAALDEHKPGDEVKLSIVRAGRDEPLQQAVALGRRGDVFASSQRSDNDDDPLFGVPEETMRMEYERRLEEHDERMEGLVLEVLKELRELRQEVDALRGKANIVEGENR